MDVFKILKGEKKPTLRSNQHWQYKITADKQLLCQQGLTQSMSGKSNYHDNAMIENFFGTIRPKLNHLKQYTRADELKKDIQKYIKYYSNDRSKIILNVMSLIKRPAHHCI